MALFVAWPLACSRKCAIPYRLGMVNSQPVVLLRALNLTTGDPARLLIGASHSTDFWSARWGQACAPHLIKWSHALVCG
jgi:hypothetical protein